MSNEIIIKKAQIEDVLKIDKKITEFERHSKKYFEDRLRGRQKLITVSYINSKPAGYIIWYDRYEDKSLYCWMAAVDPAFRRKGILKLMMNHGLEWADSMGFRKIRIKTRNNLGGMLAYLIKNGFNVINFEKRANVSDNRIEFEKHI